jgi:predicted nucleic acid-binding protein
MKHVISFLTRLTVASSLYVALAERAGCQLLTAHQKVIRATRKHFSPVLPFANLP